MTNLLSPPQHEPPAVEVYVLGWASAWLANEHHRFAIPDQVVRELARRGWISFLGPKEGTERTYERLATLTPEGRRQALRFSAELGIGND